VQGVPQVSVPVYFAMGRYDWMAPASVNEAYWSALTAPRKEWVWFEKSAHFPHWEESGEFHALLLRVLRESANGA